MQSSRVTNAQKRSLFTSDRFFYPLAALIHLTKAAHTRGAPKSLDESFGRSSGSTVLSPTSQVETLQFVAIGRKRAHAIQARKISIGPLNTSHAIPVNSTTKHKTTTKRKRKNCEQKTVLDSTMENSGGSTHSHCTSKSVDAFWRTERERRPWPKSRKPTTRCIRPQRNVHGRLESGRLCTRMLSPKLAGKTK